MTFKVSQRLDQLSKQVNKKPQIILEIDGFDETFGALTITEAVRIGATGLEIGNFNIGGLIVKEGQRPFITFKGSSNTLKQQILQDKGGTSSIQRLTIKMIDKNQELTKLFQPGNIVPDIIFRRCRIHMGFVGGAFPEDFINIFNGFVDDIDFGSGFVNMVIGHPDSLLRNEVFERVKTTLTTGIDAVTTTVILANASELLLPADMLSTYVQIGDEIIQYTGVTGGTTLTGVTRGALSAIDPATAAVSHNAGSKVKSFYRLQENAITMALKLMLSKDTNTFVTDVEVKTFVKPDPTLTVPNSIFFFGVDLEARFGLVKSDKVTISGATNSANNFTERIIVSFTKTSGGTYIVVDGADLIIEETTSAVASFRSQFDVLPVGAGMQLSPIDVDVPQHLSLLTLLTTAIPTYDFYVKNTKKAKAFIDQEIYFPSGLFKVSRKGKVSVNTNLPPLAIQGVVTLDENSIKNPSQLKVERTLAKSFYNKVIFEFDENILDDDVQFDRKISSQASKDRIPVGDRPLTITAKGLRKTTANENAIDIIIGRLLDRYKFGAEGIPNVGLLLKEGYKIEVSDTAIFGTEALQISDSVEGNRRWKPRAMEVLNKTINTKTMAVTVDLLDTAFGLESRFGVISPASIIKAGATTTIIPLKQSYGTLAIEFEEDKWDRYIGELVLIHNEDYTFAEERTLKRFQLGNVDVMIVDPPLSIAPSEDFIVKCPDYSGDTDTKTPWKSFNCFHTPEVAVISGASDLIFTVAAGEGSKFTIDLVVRIHNRDFTVDSGKENIVKVIDITGDIITVDKSIGFTPSSSEFVNLIGFDSDGGKPYTYV